MHNPEMHNQAENQHPRPFTRPDRARPLYVGSPVYRRAAFGSNHPLKIMRHSSVLELVELLDWLPDVAFRDTVPADVEQLVEFHDRDYIRALQYAESAGRVSPEVRERYHIGTLENPVFEGLFERAAMTVAVRYLPPSWPATGIPSFTHPAERTTGCRTALTGFAISMTRCLRS